MICFQAKFKVGVNQEKRDERIYFPQLLQSKEDCLTWVSNFVEYYLMRQILFTQSSKSFENNQDCQIRFWFYQIELKNNFVKALFYSKIW